MVMEDLIKRIEAADGPSRELDWLIAEALGEVPEHHIQEIGFHYEWWRKSSEFSLRRATDSSGRTIESWQPKPRTSSIDAAMTLVPDGFIIKEYTTSKLVPHTFEVSKGVGIGGFVGHSDHSMALALCAAAMKAWEDQ